MTDTSRAIQIVASDLDGTLLAPNHQLSTYSKETLAKLHQAGFHFVFATGRHHIDVAGIREITGIPAFMITSNGARVHTPSNELMFSKDIPSHLVQPIIDLIKDDDELYIHIYRSQDWLLNREDESLRKFHDESGFKHKIYDANQAPNTDVSKIFFTHTGKSYEHLAKYEAKLNETFGDQIEVAFSTPWCLEVMGANVSKGHALDLVAQHLGYDLSHCIAFGDGMNDIEMLRMAHNSCVMGTAHERVFAALPDHVEVIGSNADDAVAHYLTEHLLSNAK
jgi:Cof subfamily protein (haloacid dehalogenase superfamily)